MSQKDPCGLANQLNVRTEHSFSAVSGIHGKPMWILKNKNGDFFLVAMVLEMHCKFAPLRNRLGASFEGGRERTLETRLLPQNPAKCCACVFAQKFETNTRHQSLGSTQGSGKLYLGEQGAVGFL